MKQLWIIWLIGSCMLSIRGVAQSRTSRANEQIELNGLKLGYVYTPQQVTQALGEPTGIYIYDADFGRGYEFTFGKDMTVRFDENEQDKGLYEIILRNDNYTLEVYGMRLKTGQNAAKIRSHPSYSHEEKKENRIYFYMNRYEEYPTFSVDISKEGIITQLYCNYDY